MTYPVGALVRARGLEWVVLPESSDDLLMLRPLGGADDEVTGIYLPIEGVEAARFPPPDAARIGDDRSCRLLRDAVRLGFRSSAGPFRSFGRIGVEPRPYQLVPITACWPRTRAGAPGWWPTALSHGRQRRLRIAVSAERLDRTPLPVPLEPATLATQA